jgi:hypothetical protein
MTGNKQLMAEIAASARNEQEQALKQREWMK